MIALAFFIHVALAGPATKIYDFGDRKIEFVADPGTGDLLSRGCMEPSRCRARKALGTVTLDGIRIRHGDDLPKAREALCRQSGGRTVVGYSPRKAERAFCLFSDQSLVSLDSLFATAQSKQRR